MRYVGLFVLAAVLSIAVGCSQREMSEKERLEWELRKADRTSKSSTDTTAGKAERLRAELEEAEAASVSKKSAPAAEKTK